MNTLSDHCSIHVSCQKQIDWFLLHSTLNIITSEGNHCMLFHWASSTPLAITCSCLLKDIWQTSNRSCSNKELSYRGSTLALLSCQLNVQLQWNGYVCVISSCNCFFSCHVTMTLWNLTGSYCHITGSSSNTLNSWRMPGHFSTNFSFIYKCISG